MVRGELGVASVGGGGGGWRNWGRRWRVLVGMGWGSALGSGKIWVWVLRSGVWVAVKGEGERGSGF